MAQIVVANAFFCWSNAIIFSTSWRGCCFSLLKLCVRQVYLVSFQVWPVVLDLETEVFPVHD